MSDLKCVTHPQVEAVFRCDGCLQPLCGECIEEGHRLLFCRLCGERALPVAATGPTTSTEYRRARRRAAPYGLREALQYPFRGLGRYVYWGYVLVLALFAVLGAIPGLGCGVLLLRLLILLMLPGLLFAIVRTTADGEDELPDWPDWSEGGQRLWEWCGALLAFAVALVPLFVLAFISGCDAEALWQPGLQCSLVVLIGSIVGAVLWIPAFGSVAVEWSPFLALRIDLHLRSLAALGADVGKTLGLLVALLVARQVLVLLLLPIPIAGALAQIVVGTYTLLTGAHLIGLLFRRHAVQLDAIYN